jgi:predicted nuclease of restriction endonuclease-like (RecB) superfamily
VQSPIAQFQSDGNKDIEIRQSLIAQSFELQILVPPEKILSELSYTHLVQLLPVKDPLKRAFYEVECIKGSWSVRELQRQIETLYFERCGMSISPEKLLAQIQNNAETSDIIDVIKSPFTFEFLGLKAKDVVEESDIETALITQLQDFLLELGYGFCFEARQKRILIDGEYFFVDLIFYHRILKCHILVELKNGRFKHENIAQLNTYVSYYRHNVMRSGDSPPIGILLCTDKSDELVKYAIAGMDNQLFVSKYLVELPKKDEWMKFIKYELSR